LYAINPDGSGLERWSNSVAVSRDQPVWSPDGRRIAYTDLQVQVAIAEAGVPVEQQEVTLLPGLPGAGRAFNVWDWSADGTRLAGMALSRSGIPSGIVVYSFETDEYSTLTSFGFGPFWLNDNRRLLFSDRGSVYLLDSSSGQYREVLSVRPDDLSGAFSLAPDDRALYVSRTSSEADVWLVKFD
jgi:Tol biopolymer transport system component